MKTPRCVLIAKMVLVLLPFNLLFMTQSSAVTNIHCVDTSTALDTVLKSLPGSDGVGDSDQIRIRTGVYLAPAAGWKTTATDHDLFIFGGYTDAQCTQRSLDAAATVLDGIGANTVLRIDSGFASSRIEISGLTFQQGNGSGANESPAGGLKVADPGPIHAGDVLIERNIFRNNSATSSGGSVGGGLVAATDGNLVVRNNVFLSNIAPNTAAAFLFSNNAIAFSNNSIVNNDSVDPTKTQRTSVDFFTFGGLKLDNNVFWGNHVGPGIFDINLGGQFAGATANNNDFESTAGNAVSEKNSLHIDPAFTNNVGVQPKWKSPLIDAGTANPAGGTSPVDVHGSLRLDGPGLDIGAIETDYIFVDGLE